MTDELPRRPFHALPAPPDGLGSAMSGGRRLRRRRQVRTLTSGLMVVVVALAVLVAATGASPIRTEDLITEQTPTAHPSSPAPGLSTVAPRPSGHGKAPRTASPAPPTSTRPTTTGTTAPRGASYRTPALRRTYAQGDPLGARVCAPESTNGRTRPGWCLDAVVTGTPRGHDLTLLLCRDQTGPASLTFREKQETELVVRRGAREVWRWSTGHELGGTGHSLSVEAGACWRWTAPWTDVDAAGRELPGGNYELTVVSLAAELKQLPDETVPFRL